MKKVLTIAWIVLGMVLTTAFASCLTEQELAQVVPDEHELVLLVNEQPTQEDEPAFRIATFEKFGKPRLIGGPFEITNGFLGLYKTKDEKILVFFQSKEPLTTYCIYLVVPAKEIVNV